MQQSRAMLARRTLAHQRRLAFQQRRKPRKIAADDRIHRRLKRPHRRAEPRDRRPCESLPVLSPASYIVPDGDAAAAEVHTPYESPFMECPAVRMNQAERRFVTMMYVGGWAQPFPRTGCAPSAGGMLA